MKENHSPNGNLCVLFSFILSKKVFRIMEKYEKWNLFSFFHICLRKFKFKVHLTVIKDFFGVNKFCGRPQNSNRVEKCQVNRHWLQIIQCLLILSFFWRIFIHKLLTFCLTFCIFTKFSQTMWLINTSNLVYWYARCDCRLWKVIFKCIGLRILNYCYY